MEALRKWIHFFEIQFGITNQRIMARELLRIHLTLHAAQQLNLEIAESNINSLYQLMQETTEHRLDRFIGDAEMFFQVLQLGRTVDLLQAWIFFFKNRGYFGVMVPSQLVQYFQTSLQKEDSKTVLIPETYRFLDGLPDLIQTHWNKYFVFTAEETWMAEGLRFLFCHFPNVEVWQVSIYRPLEFPCKFDRIICIPAFGWKVDESSSFFLTRESDGIAIENLLPFLNEDGEMQVVVPARFAFSSGRFAALRSWILKNYAVKSIFALPPETFAPYVGIKTYLFTFSARPAEKVAIGTVQKKEEMYLPEIKREISPKELMAREDWPVELFLIGPISELIPESHPRVKLKEVAEIFRGKSIGKKKDSGGNVAVLNISNIDHGEILWDSIEKIDEDEHKIEKYELQIGDVVLTCRGTVNKVAVVRELPMKVIPSANLIVIRLHSMILSDYLKIFLESPVGEKLIQSFQRGTTVMNINPRDLGELEIPLKDLSKQKRLVEEYRREHELYLKTIQQAHWRWQEKRESIYKQILAD